MALPFPGWMGFQTTYPSPQQAQWHLMDLAPGPLGPWALLCSGSVAHHPFPAPSSTLTLAQPTQVAPAAPCSAAPPPAALVEGGVPTALGVPRDRVGYHVADFQEGEVAKEILVGHPVVGGAQSHQWHTHTHRPPPEPPRSRLGCNGRQEDDGGGHGTDQNSPSSFLCSSCLWTSGATSSHSLALEQRQVGEQSSFLPQGSPHP